MSVQATIPTHEIPSTSPAPKYNEDKAVEEIRAYLMATYGQHYVSSSLQTFDVWESMGSLESSCRDTAIKYLMRYGKKEGRNRKDLLKAIHYIVIMMYCNNKQGK